MGEGGGGGGWRGEVDWKKAREETLKITQSWLLTHAVLFFCCFFLKKGEYAVIH